MPESSDDRSRVRKVRVREYNLGQTAIIKAGFYNPYLEKNPFRFLNPFRKKAQS